MQARLRDFYASPAPMTSGGRHARRLTRLPRDRAALARLVQGLVLHEHFAGPAYGVELSDARRRESQLRRVERMLDRVFARRDAPLSAARPTGRRVVGVCRHIATLFVAMLRARGVPARARCGFGAYFIPGRFEDHWVAECWSAGERRWILVDAQLDDVQQKFLGIDFDPLDVPRDRFVVAGEAWARCRAGDADPDAFGLSGALPDPLHGLWFAAGNVIRDLAALNKVEMLPWDVWGAMPGAGDEPPAESLPLLDRIAALTTAPDASFAEVRRIYEDAGRVRVPAKVFNALRDREEAAT